MSEHDRSHQYEASDDVPMGDISKPAAPPSYADVEEEDKLKEKPTNNSNNNNNIEPLRAPDTATTANTYANYTNYGAPGTMAYPPQPYPQPYPPTQPGNAQTYPTQSYPPQAYPAQPYPPPQHYPPQAYPQPYPPQQYPPPVGPDGQPPVGYTYGIPAYLIFNISQHLLQILINSIHLHKHTFSFLIFM